jgi:hypothetical protein
MKECVCVGGWVLSRYIGTGSGEPRKGIWISEGILFWLFHFFFCIFNSNPQFWEMFQSVLAYQADIDLPLEDSRREVARWRTSWAITKRNDLSTLCTRASKRNFARRNTTAFGPGWVGVEPVHRYGIRRAKKGHMNLWRHFILIISFFFLFF